MLHRRAAGGVVVDPHGRIALVRQRQCTWSLPKGHLEEGEGALEGARREIQEECGLAELELVGELGTYSRRAVRHGRPEHKTITLFLFRSPEATLHPQDPANPEARWVEADDVAGMLTHAADGRFFERHARPRL